MPMTRSEACWNPAVPPPPVAGAAVGAGLELGLVLGELLAELDPLADEPVEDDDEGVGSAPEDGVPEHAAMAREASRVTMPQPTAASLVLDPVPVTVLRTFMEPPHASGRKRRGP